MSDSPTLDDLPAVLGGAPIFDEPVSIVRPVLPQLDELADDLAEMLSSGMVTKGKHLRAFEEAMAEHLGVRHAVAVSSCTSGLMLAYDALELRGEVVVPSYTFMATVSSLVRSGLKPVFADVDRATTNLDPQAAREAITPATSAIVAVHNFGAPAEIDALRQLASEHNLRLIFDAAHGFGSQYQGVPVGGQADVHVYSLSPTKLVIAGEGGIVATNDDEIADRVRRNREYGMAPGYDSLSAGMNARMSEFQALLGRRSLARLPAAVARRNEVAKRYRQRLGELPGVCFQQVRPGDCSSYKDFAIFVEPEGFGMNRDELARALAAEGVDTRAYYNPPVHRQTAYRRFAAPETSLANTDWLCQRVLCLPIYSDMEDERVDGVCQAIGRIQRHASQVASALRAESGAAERG